MKVCGQAKNTLQLGWGWAGTTGQWAVRSGTGWSTVVPQLLGPWFPSTVGQLALAWSAQRVGCPWVAVGMWSECAHMTLRAVLNGIQRVPVPALVCECA